MKPIEWEKIVDPRAVPNIAKFTLMSDKHWITEEKFRDYLDQFEPFSQLHEKVWDPEAEPTYSRWWGAEKGEWVMKDFPPRDEFGKYRTYYVNHVIRLLKNHGEEQADLALRLLQDGKYVKKEAALLEAANQIGHRLAGEKGAIPWGKELDGKAAPHMHAFAQVFPEINQVHGDLRQLFQRLAGNGKVQLPVLLSLLSHWKEGGLRRVRFVVEQAEKGTPVSTGPETYEALTLRKTARERDEASTRAVESSVVHRDDIGALASASQQEQGTRIERKAILNQFELDEDVHDKLLEMTNVSPSSLRWALKKAEEFGQMDMHTITHLGLCWQYYPKGAIWALNHEISPFTGLFFHVSHLVHDYNSRFLIDLKNGRLGPLRPEDAEQAIVAASWHGTEGVRAALKAGVRGKEIRQHVAQQKSHFPPIRNLGQWNEIKETCPPLHRYLAGSIPEWAKTRLIEEAKRAKKILNGRGPADKKTKK